VILELLNGLPGVRCVRPGGAFYAFPNIAGTGFSARQLQDDLLNETGVALVAGTSFGAEGEGYIRFSYANSIANIEEAIERIRRFLER
jgi:aspartate/methionine/tyrosine aminotransferase